MNLSKSTLETLKNFSQINDGVILKPGKDQETLSIDHSIIAEAVLEDEIPLEVAIHNLSSFLGVLSLYENPELQFEDKYVTISDGDIPFRYYYSEPGLIHVRPEGRTIELTQVDIKFDLSIKSMERLLKLASVTTLPHLIIGGKADDLYMKVDDIKNENSSFGTKTIGKYDGEEFELGFTIENLKIIPDDYEVAVGSIKGNKLARFTSKTNNRVYYVPCLKSKK